MKLNLLFDNITPVSLNQSAKITTIGKFARKYKTDKTKQFESNISNQLRKFKSELNRFNKHYDKDNYYIVADYRFFMPILLKDGSRISKKSLDLSNCVKVLEDQVFKHLHADDSEVAVLNVMKVESKHPRIEVDLELRDIRHIK